LLKLTELGFSLELFYCRSPKMLASNSASAVNRNPLIDAGVLEQVLGYVGPGHWLFIAVCKLWQQPYMRVAATDPPEEQMSLFRLLLTTPTFSCGPQMTLRKAVFASESRLRWAYAAGLKLVSDDSCEMRRIEYLAGLYADQGMLALAFELDSGLQRSLAVAGCSCFWMYQQDELAMHSTAAATA
jgi:hypothetical protein